MQLVRVYFPSQYQLHPDAQGGKLTMRSAGKTFERIEGLHTALSVCSTHQFGFEGIYDSTFVLQRGRMAFDVR